MSITWLTNINGEAHGLTEPFEEHDSVGESADATSVSAKVTLRCLWSERHAIRANILLAPKEWPYQTGDAMFASKCTIRSDKGAGTQVGQGYSYEQALLDVDFQTMQTNSGGGPITLYTERIRPTAEFITVPHEDFRWQNGNGTALRPQEAPGRLTIGLEYVVTLFNMPSIPSWVLTLVDRCNISSVFSPSLGVTFPAQTLLFNPPDISRTVALGSLNRYTIATAYTFRAAGWNKFWRAETGTWESMYFAGTATPYNNFPTANFGPSLPT